MDASLTADDRSAQEFRDALARLENCLDLLRREWREDFPAGLSYAMVLGNVRRVRQYVATDPTEHSPARIPIETRRYVGSERRVAYALVREEVAKGHQIFVVCPTVADAVEEAERLRRDVFPDLRIATLHDRMKRWEQSDVITAFRDHQFDLLVSTPVIEVGIDIPIATVMLIEGADRFDLAQLHQLRGQVGRGGSRSYCVLIADEGNRDSEERLVAMVATGNLTGIRLSELRNHIAADLAAVNDDLEAYSTLPREHRPAALTAIADAITRLIPLITFYSDPVYSMTPLENGPMPATAPASRVGQNAVSGTFTAPTTLVETLHRLSPMAFEHLVAELLRARGFAQVQRVGGANDRGVDILCRDSDGSLIAVQCKRYAPNDTSRRVGAPVVQLLSAMALQRRAHRGILVTTAACTASARNQAHDFDIELIDGEDLVSMLQEHAQILERIRAG